MKTNKLLFAAIALMALVACSSDDKDDIEQRVPVRLTYNNVDAAETRAATNLNSGTFDTGENVMVRISNTGANAWTDYTFTTGDAGAMSAPDPAPYYPAGSQNIDIVAYYPATAGETFTVAADQRADADYKASDLMFASVTNQAKQAEAVNLSFAHKMAKLCVNVSTGQGVTSINSVSILNVLPTVSFDHATGEVGSASGDAIRIAVSNNGAAVIPAQTINGGLLIIVTDKGTATYSVSNKDFAAGNKYTLNITVNLREVGATTAITDWVTNETSLGDADINLMMTATTPAGLEVVDLGHPGGVMWANMNVGAESETDCGDYFAWGATVPFYQEGYSQEIPCTHWIDGKTGYNWASYPFMQSGRSDDYHITKYTFADMQTSGIWYSGTTFIGDGKTSFADYDYIDDAARANWGGGWRTPTHTEWTWLRENCNWTWMEDYKGTGVNGMLGRSKIAGYTDNTIFLPAAGEWSSNSLNNVGTRGSYWSSSIDELHSDSRYALDIGIDNERITWGTASRDFGFSVRPVIE